ncbi:MAG: lamin tail domain-containing protein [Bacteroidetes bacterium]|nr:lamin tail domain-containing protein [Bacteroidota bacterium]MDA1242964.1 lamin tail domain-containing protein [Bacteroidota bacterium]
MRTNISLAILALFVLVPFSGALAQHTLTVESSAAVGAGGTVYRFYVNANDDTDKFSAVFGNNESHLVISAPDGIFNTPLNASWNASGINPAFLGVFPDLADDSYATIGLEGPASTSGLAGAADPSIVEDPSLSPTISGYFTAGGTLLNVNTLVGGSWYVLNTAANALPIGGRWLVAQVTTTGTISGTMNYQVFPLGVGDDQKQFTTDFDGAGTFTGTCLVGCDGGPVDVLGCTDPAACNYDSSATLDDGSCAASDVCGVCGGTGIPEGDCDCFGNQLDALGVCGGECFADDDSDGICDNVDDCVGTLDACGVCNGPGAIYACGCSEIPSGDCDCDGNQLDACGVCGGDGSSCVGCMDSAASNYNMDASSDDGSCVYATTFNVDMSCATNVGAMLNGSAGFSEVFVTGPVFGWAANDGYNQLTDADGDGIYSVTLDFPAGDIEYKYAIDGFADQEQLVDDMQNGGTCAPITDYAGYANRQVAAGSTANDTYGSCSTCAEQVAPVNVTFQVDMSQYAEPYTFGGVFVNGSFNGWCGACNPMTDMGGGLWSLTLPLIPGTIEYKFTLDGWNYQEEFAGGESCTSTIDGFTNRTLTFDADVTLAAVCWEMCDVCPDISDVLGCMDPTANNYNAEATVQPENSCLYDVTLSVDASQTSFTSMNLAGAFNGWNNLSNPMDDIDGDGVYTVTVSMTAGNQEYKFLGNGDWGAAEVFDGTEDCTTPPAEFVNRVILVAGPTVADLVCYNSCTTCVQGAVLGCTDANAINYNEAADTDNGSCAYDVTVTVEVCGGTSEEVRMTGPWWGWDPYGGPIATDNGDGTFSVLLPNVASSFEYLWVVGGVQENLIEAMQNGGSCAPVTDYFAYANRQWNQGDANPSDVYNSCDACPEGVEGCIDEAACNYDPSATVQAFGDGSINLTWTSTGSYPSEVSFSIDGTSISGGTSTSGDFALAPGTYTVSATDSFGDSWNGYELTITDAGSGNSYVIANENLDGVTGSETQTFEIVVTGASTCTYPTNPALDCDGNCANGGVLYAFNISDQYSDGMCCAYGQGYYSITVDGVEVATGSDFGSSASHLFCADAGACVAVTFVQDNYPGEQTWSLTADGTEVLGAGLDGSSATYYAGGCVLGCDDETACNYNAEANVNDGSCEFAPEYYECDGETCINDANGNGVCDELEVYGCVVPTACNYEPNATQLVPCVYPDPGYNCDGTCISDTDADGTCDANEIVGCQDSTACNYDASATDEGACDYDSCLGCTDADACNYDDTATQDDGTCDFCSCANNASGGVNGFNLSVETHAENGIPGLTTYRVYVTTPNADDFVSAIAGDLNVASYLRTSTSFYQNPLGGLTAGAINPLFFGAFPDIQFDSWLTIGIEQAPVPGDGTADVTIAQAAGDTWPQDFEAGGNLELNSFFGGSWFTTNLTSNGVAGDDLRVLVAQLTTDGTLTGQLFVQVFPLGVGANAEYLTLTFGSSTCGCTDASACNYNDGAIYDDGSCFYVGIYDCDATCVNDADQDGVCDELEIVGCYDSEACNYNPDATDEGACEYVEPTLLPSEGGCGLFFSGYAEGSSNNKFMEIYNPTDADIDLSGYAFPNVSNAPDNGAGNYDFWNTFPEGAMIAAGDVYVIAHGSANPSILAEADMTFNFLSNGDDGFMLVQGDEANYIMIDAIGDFNGDPGSGWDVAGVTNGTANHSLIRKSHITSGNGGDWIGSAGTDAENSEWIVLNQDDWTGVGSHEFTGDCAAGNYAVIYDCDGVCLNDSDEDGVCDEIEIDGCMDSGACNYDLLATDEDGSCEYLTCAGCTDSVGCNYDSSATIEDGSCTYPDLFYDCDGNCVNDLNINGICDELEVLGCTYSAACNYDMDANVDDGQCDFSCLLTGCTDSAADNYDAAATVDDGNCFYVGCLDTNALNFDSGANFPGNCEYCEGDFNYDGEVDVNDLLDFFQLWGNTCD